MYTKKDTDEWTEEEEEKKRRNGNKKGKGCGVLLYHSQEMIHSDLQQSQHSYTRK